MVSPQIGEKNGEKKKNHCSRLEFWLHVSDYVSKGIEKTLKSFDRSDMCREVSRLLSSWYQEAQKHEFSKEKRHDMNANKINTIPNKQRSMSSTQT